MRDAPIITLLALLVVASIAGGRARAAPPPHRQRAEAAYAAMQRALYLPDMHLYREDTSGAGNPYAYHWPYGQALAATIDMALLAGSGYRADIDDRLLGLEPYWDAANVPPSYDSYVVPPLGHGGDVYYDDNEWTGLELMRVYQLSGELTALRRAQQIFELVVFGWDSDSTHAAPGGVFWKQEPGNLGRGVVSNAPAAQLALLLHAATREPHYLEWALRLYGWVDATLRAPNGLYWDSIAADGAIDTTQWSYNQGTMLGASVMLYQQTGDATYLERARQIAATALELYRAGDGFWGQPAAFNAIWWKNLLLLDAVEPRPAYRAAMQEYANQAWERVRDPATDLHPLAAGRVTRLLDQAAMVQVYAALAREPNSERTFLPGLTR